MDKPARLLDGAPYVKSSDMGPDYLKRKFAKIQREIDAKRRDEKVTPINKARKAQ